jgi:hypothetical protein
MCMWEPTMPGHYAAFLAPRPHVLQFKQLYEHPLTPSENFWGHLAVVPLSVPSSAHPLASPTCHPTPPRTPSHHPSHGPSHVTVTTTAIPVAAIAATASTSEALRANTLSLWHSNSALPEVLEVQECLIGLCRRAWVVAAVAF